MTCDNCKCKIDSNNFRNISGGRHEHYSQTGCVMSLLSKVAKLERMNEILSRALDEATDREAALIEKYVVKHPTDAAEDEFQERVRKFHEENS